MHGIRSADPIVDRPQARQLEELLAGIGECVVHVDAHWRVRYCSPAYLEGLGLPASEVIGRTPFEYQAHFEESVFHRVLQAGRVLDAQPLPGRLDGALVLRLSAAAVRRAADGVAGYLRPVELRLAQARCEGGGPDVFFGGVRAARVLQAGRVLDALPLPGRLDGALVLELQLIHGTALRIEAGALTLGLAPDAEAVFRESCDC